MQKTKVKAKIKVGVGIVVKNNNGEILLIKRKNIHGTGEWALPGGKVEFGESFENASIRELREEVNLNGINPHLLSLSNQRRYLKEGIHSVIIGVEEEVKNFDDIEIVEPDKCDEFKWFKLDALPRNLFEGSEQIIQSLKDKGTNIKYIN